MSGVQAARELLLATHNDHKRREFERLLQVGGPVSITLRALPDEVELPPEDADSFAGNALGKARAAAAQTGTVAIADDSGICAQALGGAPGVRSARYAGEHASDQENLDKLLREAPAGSALEYVCVIAYVEPALGLERCFEGRCSGRLAATPGATGVSATTRPSNPRTALRGRPWRSSATPKRTRSATVAGRPGRSRSGWRASRRPPRRDVRYSRLMAAATATARPSPA